MRPSEVDELAAGYRELYAGNLAAALRAAVTDLLDVQEEAERQKAALDAWVSRGYVQGRASERLASRLEESTLRSVGQGSTEGGDV